MMTVVLCLVSFGAGVIAGAAALHRIRAGGKRAPIGFNVSHYFERPARTRRVPLVEASDPDHIEALLRGDV